MTYGIAAAAAAVLPEPGRAAAAAVAAAEADRIPRAEIAAMLASPGEWESTLDEAFKR